MEVGQDRELYPNLPLIGEALHCSTPPTPRNTQTEGKKSGLERGDSKKERPIDTSAES